MKKYLIALAFVALLAGCTTQNYDDSVILDKIASLDSRVQALEGNMLAVQSALEGKTVQKVEELKNDAGIVVGVNITYTDGSTYHFEITTATTADGPALCIMANGAGELCWALDFGGTTGKVILKDGEGNDVRIYMSPTFEIGEDGHLYMTLEGTKTDLGKAVASGGVQDGIVKGIEVTEDAVIITYDTGGDEDGVISIPLVNAFKLVIEQTAFKITSTDPITIPYTITNKTDKTVVDAYFNEDKFGVAIDATKLVVTPKAADAAGMILVYADSKTGLTSIVKLTLGPNVSEPEIWDKPDEPTTAAVEAGVDYLVKAAGGTVNAHVVTNVEFEVAPQAESWIHVGTPTKAPVTYTIPITVDANTTADPRTANVVLYRKGTTETVQTIKIGQEEAVLPPGPIPGNPDLSAGGLANCYIVYEAGEYKFKTVKGNSEESVGAVASAAIIWETVNTADEIAVNDVIASVSYADNYITFTTANPVKPGNALIAAKDGEGNILWSWHIWIPETTIELDTYGLVSKNLMDRNLGALVAAPADAAVPAAAIGLTYEWGRKDPFPGASSITSGSNAFLAGEQITFNHGTTISVADAIAQPTNYPSTDNSTWSVEEDLNLWSPDSKTIYDPCPAGYRVPANDSTQPLMSGSFESLPGWTVNTANGFILMGDPVAVFPICGYRDDYTPATVAKMGQRVAYWLANSVDAAKAYHLNLRPGSSYTVDGTARSRGAYVRCIKQ